MLELGLGLGLGLGVWEGMVHRIRLVDVDTHCGQIAASCCVLFYKACRILNSKLIRAVSRKYVQRKTFPCTHIVYLGMCMSMFCSYLSMVLLGNITILERINTYMFFTLAK